MEQFGDFLDIIVDLLRFVRLSGLWPIKQKKTKKKEHKK